MISLRIRRGSRIFPLLHAYKWFIWNFLFRGDGMGVPHGGHAEGSLSELSGTSRLGSNVCIRCIQTPWVQRINEYGFMNFVFV